MNYVAATHGGVARFHRPTCKRVKKMDPAVLSDAATFAGELVPATCCKPNADELRRQRTGASSARVAAERVAAEARVAALVAESHANAANGAGNDDTPAEGPVRRHRNKTARWAEAMRIRKAANRRRGPGVRVSEDDLVAYCARIQAEESDTTMEAEAEIAYWLENMAVSRLRFYAAWAKAATAPAVQKAS